MVNPPMDTMDKGKLKHILILGALLLAGLAIGAAIAKTVQSGNAGVWVEKMRVTSPNGQLDALLEAQIHTNPESIDWYVNIVPKGQEPSPHAQHILQAGTLIGAKLVWAQPHLLEIHYDEAGIDQFRNWWGLNEVQPDKKGAGDYFVEIRLAPSSPDFSLLNPNGQFKSK